MHRIPDPSLQSMSSTGVWPAYQCTLTRDRETQDRWSFSSRSGTQRKNLCDNVPAHPNMYMHTYITAGMSFCTLTKHIWKATDSEKESENKRKKQPKHTGWMTVSHNATQFLWNLVSSSEKPCNFLSYSLKYKFARKEEKSKLWDKKKNHNCEKRR